MPLRGSVTVYIVLVYGAQAARRGWQWAQGGQLGRLVRMRLPTRNKFRSMGVEGLTRGAACHSRRKLFPAQRSGQHGAVGLRLVRLGPTGLGEVLESGNHGIVIQYAHARHVAGAVDANLQQHSEGIRRSDVAVA